MFLSLTTALFFTQGPAPAADAPPSRAQLHQAVERSLVFLDKSAAEWMHGNNQVGVKDGRPVLVKGTQAACASCHHVPMTVWCMTEAKNHGFKVNDADGRRLPPLVAGSLPQAPRSPALRSG